MLMTRSSLILIALFAANPALAQKMGGTNTNAPDIQQSIQLGKRGRIAISYQAITWSGGRWAKALQDETTRDAMRNRINAAAKEFPLGSLETDRDLNIGQGSIPAGRYALSFQLDENFAWQLVLGSEKTYSFDLPLANSSKVMKRLTLHLDAGEEDFTASLTVAFGAKECALPVRPSADTIVRNPTQILNQNCPVSGEAVDPDQFVTFRGYKIGMCCEDCIADWNELSKDEKDQHLKKLLAK